jgi:hypothetical protein
MKAWISFALVAGIVFYLLLSPGLQAMLLPPGDHYGTCWNQEEAVSSLPTTWVAARTAVQDAVAAPREPVVRDGVLTTQALAPPGGETHGPPKIARGGVQLAAQPPGQSNEQMPCSGIFLPALPVKL